jgi:hypothetical protein
MNNILQGFVVLASDSFWIARALKLRVVNKIHGCALRPWPGMWSEAAVWIPYITTMVFQITMVAMAPHTTFSPPPHTWGLGGWGGVFGGGGAIANVII